MSRRIIFTAVFIIGGFVVKAQDNKVAVFDPAGDVTSSIKEIVREEISASIVNMTDYTVLERSLISKVLEENKFQTSGLVDDSQISEMGMRMGANYVFVTNITSLGSNYYISCKMIEVLTARIDKQKTARTTQGANDLIDVVSNIMGSMFGKQRESGQNTIITRKRVQSVSAEEDVAFVQTDCGCDVMKNDAEKGLSPQIVILKAGLFKGYTTEALDSFCPNGWRSPTFEELNCIYSNKNTIGGFGNGGNYYSSKLKTIGLGVLGVGIDFDSGKEKIINGYRVANLRCVRDRK